jgi:hypothetical protein
LASEQEICMRRLMKTVWKTVPEIFEALGGSAAVARIIRVKKTTASEMKRRGTIPSEHWVDLVSGAHAMGAEFTWLTYDYLAHVHALAKGKLSEDCCLAGGT